MIFVFAVFMAICFYKSKIFTKQFNSSYISKESTTAVEGVFAFLILMSHFTLFSFQKNVFDTPYIEVRDFMGQMVVSSFFVYSGYGIFESIKKKGLSYINSFPKKRILKLWLHMDIAVIIFTLVFIVLRKKFTVFRFFLSLLGWENIGNNNWFIFATMIFSVGVYISFKLFNNKPQVSLACVTAWVVIYMIVMKQFKTGFWYNSALCFPLGMWYSYFKDKIESFIMKSNKRYLIVFCVTLILFLVGEYFRSRYEVSYFFELMLFGLLIVLVTMKVSIGNKVLNWLGTHAFSIYMLQKIPMFVFRDMGFMKVHPYISFALVVIATVIFSQLFDMLTGIIDKKLFVIKKGTV